MTAKRRPRVRVTEQTAALAKGEVPVEEWDKEEVIRGQKRARDGTFRGRPSTLVPRPLYDELRRRTMEEVYEEVRKAAIPAATVLREMVEGKTEPDPARLRAAQEVLDRFIGKAPQKVEINAGVRPFEKVLTGGIVRDVEEDDDDDIVDAELVDEDDDWEDGGEDDFEEDPEEEADEDEDDWFED